MIALMLAVAGIPSAALTREQASGLVSGAEHAVRAGRLHQAKLMLDEAVDAGAAGPGLDRALADLAYASGANAEALARYERLLTSTPSDPSLLEPAGISALKLGYLQRASMLLTRASAIPGAGWRVWDALGITADLQGNWMLADKCYAEASRLAPDEAAPLSNHGWSLLLRGRWSDALPLLEKGAAMNPKSSRAANDLELARSALDAQLPERRPGESASSWAARLNDAGVAAEILGDQKRAMAAFSRALEASDTWDGRAADNLQAIRSR